MNYSELYHHGIKGQKWGIRRYQNPDGSLTPEGRTHYGYRNISVSNHYELDMDEQTAKNTTFDGKGIKGIPFKKNKTDYGTYYEATIDGVDMSINESDKLSVYDVKESMNRAKSGADCLREQLKDPELKDNPEMPDQFEELDMHYDPKNWENPHVSLQKTDPTRKGVPNGDANLYSRSYIDTYDGGYTWFDIDFEWEKKENGYRLRDTAWND